MCKSNYEKVLINSGIGEYKHSDFLGEPVVVPTKSLVKNTKGWTREECIEHAKLSIERALPTLTIEEREGYGRTARLVESNLVSSFVESASSLEYDEEQYFVSAEEDFLCKTLSGLGLLVSSPEVERIRQDCRKDRQLYSKFRLASQAIDECETTINGDASVRMMTELSFPKIVIDDASVRAIEARDKYHQNIRKIFRKKGAKQFIIDNVVDSPNALDDNDLGQTGAKIRRLLSDSLSSSDDIMNSGRVVNGSAFSGKKNK